MPHQFRNLIGCPRRNKHSKPARLSVSADKAQQSLSSTFHAADFDLVIVDECDLDSTRVMHFQQRFLGQFQTSRLRTTSKHPLRVTSKGTWGLGVGPADYPNTISRSLPNNRLRRGAGARELRVWRCGLGTAPSVFCNNRRPLSPLHGIYPWRIHDSRESGFHWL